MKLDYAALGFKAGLEIHQQLDTPKLFCRCPSLLDEAENLVVFRTLRPTSGELGEIDPAALAEARKQLAFEYVASHATSCLVELDEEPPHPLTPEAVEVALEVSLLLGMRPVDEVHVMRKIVIDGSNTSGFQRTSLLATDGEITTGRSASAGAEGAEDADAAPSAARRRVGIATLCLEEDAARKVERKGNLVRYRLDRLGIPLVEIATTPDIKDGEHAREVAEAIGMLLRATGRVKRGIGTIRQDLNVSIRDGARIEIKGVQELRVIPIAVEYEVARQVMLLELRDYLREAERATPSPRDVTLEFKHTNAKHLKRAFEAGGVAWAIPLPRLAGKLGKKSDGPKPRFGKELADYARVASGIGGLFHSDELPDYGITADEVAAVRGALALADADAFALVAADRATCEKALAAVASRYHHAYDGVPEETRDVAEDGSSSYLRPLPGGARMYPETDVPPFLVSREVLDATRAKLPELPAAKEARLRRTYPDVAAEQLAQIIRAGDAEWFEALAKTSGMAREVARLLTGALPELERGGVPRAELAPHVPAVLAELAAGRIPKEAVQPVLAHAAKKGVPVTVAIVELGAGAADTGALDAEIARAVAENEKLVRERGLGAVGPLMGPIMAKWRGKVAGEVISTKLKDAISAKIAK